MNAIEFQILYSCLPPFRDRLFPHVDHFAILRFSQVRMGNYDRYSVESSNITVFLGSTVNSKRNRTGKVKNELTLNRYVSLNKPYDTLW